MKHGSLSFHGKFENIYVPINGAKSARRKILTPATARRLRIIIEPTGMINRNYRDLLRTFNSVDLVKSEGRTQVIGS